MIKNLIIYSTTDNHTKKICEHIAGVTKNLSKTKLLCLSEAFNEDLSNYDNIIIGASIRYGKHKQELYKFIQQNFCILDKKNNAFFSVNAVARKPEKNSPTNNPYMKKFLKLTNWEPRFQQVFAGKIDYPKYSFLDKHIIRFIMWITNGPTNLSGTYDFTNWQHVEEFAARIFATETNSQ